MKKLIFIIILCLVLPLGGCKKEPVVVKRSKAQKVEKAEVKKETAETTPVDISQYYEYDSKGRRDPFQPLVKPTKTKTVKKPGASPIESYSIDELKLLAIAWEKDKQYALILLPDKKTFTITKGMVIGLENGTVEEITPNTVVIREYVKDYKGNIKPKDTVLKLHRGEE